MNFSRLSFGGGLFLAFPRESASTESIWSCRHVYWPSYNATEHDDNICSKFAGFPQSLHFGSSDKPHTAKFVGLGSTSYTDLRRNCNLFGSIDHMSFQVTFLCLTASQFTKLPCFFMPTALTIFESSSITWTSFCTSFLCTSLPAVPLLFDVIVPRPSLPTATFPTVSACFRRNSASRTVS